jgi:hypothetical protein
MHIVQIQKISNILGVWFWYDMDFNETVIIIIIFKAYILVKKSKLNETFKQNKQEMSTLCVCVCVNVSASFKCSV